jgi:hypothetical protein
VNINVMCPPQVAWPMHGMPMELTIEN